MAELIDFLFGRGEELFLKIAEEDSPAPVPWLTDFRLEVFDSVGNHLGNVSFRLEAASHSLLQRCLFGKNHPFEAIVTNRSGGEMMRIERQGLPFLPSETSVISASGICIGFIRQQISLFQRSIQLFEGGQIFAHTNRRAKERYLFPFLSGDKKSKPGVAFKWEGKRHDLFACADSASVYFGQSDWSPAQRCLFLATGIALIHEMWR